MNLTNRRLLFQPNRVEALIGLCTKSWNRSQRSGTKLVEGWRRITTWITTEQLGLLPN